MLYRLVFLLFFLLAMLVGFQGLSVYRRFFDKPAGTQNPLLNTVQAQVPEESPPETMEEAPRPAQDIEDIKPSPILGIGQEKPQRLYDDPQFFSKEKLKILQELSARQKELDDQEADVALKKKIVEASEARIDDKIRLLKGMRQNIENILQARSKDHDERIQRLVQIYETMKPKDAAVIFNQMELNLSAEIARGMSRKSFAAVLSAMEPEKAKMLAEKYAGIDSTVPLLTPLPVENAANPLP